MKTFFKIFFVLAMVVGTVSMLHTQTTIHNWNFNVGTPTLPAQWSFPISATTGTGSLTHDGIDSVISFTGSTLNIELGDEAGGCLVPVNVTNNGKSFIYTVPTTGYKDIVLTYATRGTSTGFTSHEVLYSVDGTNFTTFQTFTGTNVTTWSVKTVDFTSITSANENVNFKIKIIIDGATAAGNNRFDNVKVQGTSTVLNDGDGTAALENKSGGTFDGSTIFPRSTGSLTVRITVTGTAAGTLDQIRLTVPAAFTGFNSGNVTLGGAFAGKSTNFVGNQITVLSAALGTTPGTITISSLTSPNPVGALNNGNSNWIVETAKLGGTLTEILSSPKSHTLIPISNLRTGGVDGYGNSDADGNISAMEGQVVAISGIATVQNGILNTIAYTSFFMQSGGYGMQIFNSTAPTAFTRGDSIVVKGTVISYNGGMEVSPPSSSSPNFFKIGTGTLPTPINILNATNITEQYEGLLVRLSTAATFDSAGQTFIASASNRGINNFRTAPNDTGTVFLHYANTNVVGKTIPSSANIIGIVHQRNDIIGLGQTKRKLAVRDLGDLGMNPADGSGTATISPVSQVSGATSVTETIVLKGDGVNTIAGMSVTIPSSWTWTGNSAHAAISGPGFASAAKSVTGDGSGGNPWVITLNSTAVTLVDTGIIAISNLTAPSAFGSYTFTVKTRGASGTLSPITVQPTVTITPSFPFIENFEYTTGDSLTAHGWSLHSGVPNPILVNANPLTYAGYVHSGVGKSVTLTTTGQDVNRGFPTVNTGSVYASFMVKVTSALTTAAGEYFFHLSPPTSTTSHLARVYFRKAANDNITFGTSKFTTTTPLYTDSIYVLNTTYLIVVKYTFNSGTTTDDEVKLWINPVLDGTEPTANLTTTDGNDATTLGLVALRQGAGNSTPALILGGLRINTSWIPSGAGPRSIIVSAGWNMISIPYTVANYTKTVLFPEVPAGNFAFSYNGTSYQQQTVLANTIGYWLKFLASDTVEMTGTDRLSDTVHVIEGWNLIGTIAGQIATSSVQQIPTGLVRSDYFGYSGSYLPVDSLKPGRAYWVKINDAGKLYMSASSVIAKQERSPLEIVKELNSLTITDRNGIEQTLYFGSSPEKQITSAWFELPPLSPELQLDVRFASGGYAEILSEKFEKAQEYPINIQASSYPLTLKWNIKNSTSNSFLLKDNEDIQQTLSGEGKLIIKQPLKGLTLEAAGREALPLQYSLGANFPNPFNPSTKFVVAVPNTSPVEVVVFDILGRKVKTLVNEVKTAGYHTIEWNGLTEDNAVATSGIYFVRMMSEKFNSVRKIVLMK
ncbi:MAG: T9SS type A sorting domain-containing protein [Bacteroidota bacterium]|nr:T9SS type A sorting domain-containing protein [Bacteroidota bacterium]